MVSPDGAVLPDVRAKAAGRGAWIGVDRATLQKAIDNRKLVGALGRAFRRRDLTIPADLAEQIAQGLERATLDRLGLEARASTILTADASRRPPAGQGVAAVSRADSVEDGNAA